MTRPQATEDVYQWLIDQAEKAAEAGLLLDDALQAVRDGYTSAEKNRAGAANVESV